MNSQVYMFCLLNISNILTRAHAQNFSENNPIQGSFENRYLTFHYFPDVSNNSLTSRLDLMTEYDWLTRYIYQSILIRGHLKVLEFVFLVDHVLILKIRSRWLATSQSVSNP